MVYNWTEVSQVLSFTEDNWNMRNATHIEANYDAFVATHGHNNSKCQVRFKNAPVGMYNAATVHHNNRTSNLTPTVCTSSAAEQANKVNDKNQEGTDNNYNQTDTQDNKNRQENNNKNHAHNNETVNCDPCANKACNDTCNGVYAYGYAFGHNAGSSLAYMDGYQVGYMDGIDNDHSANLVSDDDDTDRY